MSSRCGALAKHSLSVDSVKRSLDFDSFRTETESLRAPMWKTTTSRRLDFGETDPSVRSSFLDLLSNRINFDSVVMSSCSEGKTFFTAEQKEALEAKFRTKKYPTRNEKASLAAKLDIGVTKVQTWFTNRRRKWRKEQKKGAVGPSGNRPVLPAVSLIHTSCKRSYKGTVNSGCYPQFHALPQVPFASASHQVTQSFAASSRTRLYHQQPVPVRSPPVATETGLLPYQQLYPPFSDPVHRNPQQEPEINCIVQQAAVPPYPAHHSLLPVNPVKPDTRRLTDEHPFSYSVAKELPHIFGNLEDDEVLDRPLTPSFEPPTDYEPLWDSFAHQSAQFHSDPDSLAKQDFIDCALPDNRYLIQPNSYSSCCYGSNEMLSPPLRDISCDFISNRRGLGHFRQD